MDESEISSASDAAFYLANDVVNEYHAIPVVNRADPDEIVTRRRDGIAYLTADGDWRVPCSRYGRYSSECAEVAWRIAYLVARECGEAITHERLDHAMGLVVNDSDDVAYMVRTYGHRMYR